MSYDYNLFLTLIFSTFIIVLFDYMFFLIAKKIDYKGPFWKFLIPFYAKYLFVKSTGLNPWLFTLIYIPVVNIFFYIFLWYKVCLRLGKDDFDALFFASFIMIGFGIPIIFLAFSKSSDS